MEKKPKRVKSQLAPKDKSRLAKFLVERILESVSDSFVALDTEWRYTCVNEKAAQTFGRTREQLIGKHIWTEFPEGVGQPF
jgi:PAS domain S-box-containing protein